MADSGRNPFQDEEDELRNNKNFPHGINNEGDSLSDIHGMHGEEESVDVSFGIPGFEIVNPRPSFDTDAFAQWVEDNKENLPEHYQDNQVAIEMEECAAFFISQKGIKEGDNVLNTHVFTSVRVLTEMSYVIASLDKAITMTPAVKELIDLTGFAIVLVLWKTEDWNKQKKNPHIAHSGEIKIMTLQDLQH